MSLHRLKAIISWLVLVALALGLPCLVYSAHRSWQDHYQDASGTPCCGDRDCSRIAARLLAHEGDRAQAEVQGVPVWLPAKNVHISEDGDSWVCRKLFLVGKEEPITDGNQIRCLFVAIGG